MQGVLNAMFFNKLLCNLEISGTNLKSRRRCYLISPLLVVIAPLPLSAALSPDENAMQANNAYSKGAESGVSPLTASEMAHCHAYWNRWKYIVDSSNIPKFGKSLRTELSFRNAKKSASHWLRKSKAEYSGDLDRFSKILGNANQSADEEYANWVNGEPDALLSLPETLGTCKL